jgi:hypothetical protein
MLVRKQCIWYCNITHCVTLSGNVVSYSEGRTQFNGVREHGLKDNIFVYRERSNRKVAKGEW